VHRKPRMALRRSEMDNGLRKNCFGPIDPANFKTGIRMVFPQGLVERGDDLLVYYGAADVSVAAARVRKRDLYPDTGGVARRGYQLKQGDVPL
jgi:hypothetical protein